MKGRIGIKRQMGKMEISFMVNLSSEATTIYFFSSPFCCSSSFQTIHLGSSFCLPGEPNGLHGLSQSHPGFLHLL
jgi:hypothetical protein